MVDVSDEKIAEAFQEVQKSPDTNWLLVDYENDRSDKLVLTKTGGGGLPELADALDDGKASYAYVRVTFAKDKESKRERFVFVKWIGKGCKIMRKAKVSVQAGDVKRVLHNFSIEVDASEKTDLEEEKVVKRLRAVGGASYDGAAT